MIAYTPFLQPLNVHDVWWFMLIPMALFMSMAYKGVRLRDLSTRWYWRSVVVMVAQVVLALVGLAAGMWIAMEHVVPLFQK